MGEQYPKAEERQVKSSVDVSRVAYRLICKN